MQGWTAPRMGKVNTEQGHRPFCHLIKKGPAPAPIALITSFPIIVVSGAPALRVLSPYKKGSLVVEMLIPAAPMGPMAKQSFFIG